MSLKQPLGEDFDATGAWLIIVSMTVFIIGLCLLVANINDTICQQVVCR